MDCKVSNLVRARIAIRVRRAKLWMRNHISRGPLILLYHRVVNLPTDPQLLSVTPQHFAEHLEILRSRYFPARLRNAIKAKGRRQRDIVITFDDGYADNLHYARPLLEKYDTPATVYVATGYTGCNREFWWDELERLLLLPGTLPDSLCLMINGTPYQWNLSSAAMYSEEDYRRYRSWNLQQADNPTLRHYLYRTLQRLLHPLRSAERQRVLEAIATWARAGCHGRSTHVALTADEIVRLAEGGLIEVGAHTVTHPSLAAIPASDQRYEIQTSKAALTQILGYAPVSFSYPYGTLGDYSPETIRLVREAAFTSSCSNYSGHVSAWADHYQLPRMLVRDWDGDTFERHLRMWLGN